MSARSCLDCGGVWIRAVDYWQWRARQGKGEKLGPPEEVAPEATDQRVPKLCPEDCGFLGRYRVGKGNSLTIDRCAHCSGVWLDAQEWEILTRRGLHEHLHEVLDSEWQEELTRVDRMEAEHARHLRLLGAEDLRRIQEMRDWLDADPKKSELYAYLQHSSRL